jgi:DNA-binding response OmpR family regulator
VSERLAAVVCLRWATSYVEAPVEAHMPRAAHVLVIDDDRDMHDAVATILSQDGYRISTSCTGADGLEIMQRDRPDVVLLDIMLATPFEGVLLACRMRQDQRLRDIPIIFMSAMDEEVKRVYAQEACPVSLDSVRFLEKPLDARTLREAVRGALGERPTPP